MASRGGFGVSGVYFGPLGVDFVGLWESIFDLLTSMLGVQESFLPLGVNLGFRFLILFLLEFIMGLWENFFGLCEYIIGPWKPILGFLESILYPESPFGPQESDFGN